MIEETLFPLPKSKIRLERHAEHQHYFLADGSEVSGASGIAKLGDSYEGLIYWAWKLGMDGKDYKKVRDSATSSGTLAHFLADCHLKNAEPDLREFTDEEIALAQPSYEKFLDFWSKENLRLVAHEKQLVHEELRYGGTIDIVALDENGKMVVLDWKTSKSVYNGHKWQLAGYEMLWNYNNSDARIERRAIIRIGRDPDDKFHAHWIPEEKAKRHQTIFKAQVQLHNAINEAKFNKK